MYHIVAHGHLSPARFIWQLRFLRKHFEPVTLNELVRRKLEGSVRGKEIVLTFDDGVRNHFSVAWPILREHAIPATFFVCSDLVESDKWVWRTELRQRLTALSNDARARVAREAGCGTPTTDAIMEWTKSLSPSEVHSFQTAVITLTPRFTRSTEEMNIHKPLTWDQLRQMDTRLITIGSHTRSHSILTTLSEPQLQDEIVGSKHVLEKNLDRSIDYFSYPNGANNPAAVDLVRAHYRAAVSTCNGCLHPDDDPALLPRIAADGSRATFVRRLHRPSA